VKFGHDLSRNFVDENVISELSFLLVSHTICFDMWFGRYRFLKSGFNTDQVTR
jgi:hypothetical protein